MQQGQSATHCSWCSSTAHDEDVKDGWSRPDGLSLRRGRRDGNEGDGKTARWIKGQHMKEVGRKRGTNGVTTEVGVVERLEKGGGEVTDKTTRETWNIVSKLRKWKG